MYIVVGPFLCDYFINLLGLLEIWEEHTTPAIFRVLQFSSVTLLSRFVSLGSVQEKVKKLIVRKLIYEMMRYPV
jgi:hypothetical protein